ncbi:MAG: hypothetical protein NT033_10510 [Candidatus Omnitrophica bacterium]|nr:hypothetical protein [Candidatus Omnitrophota bacterium]
MIRIEVGGVDPNITELVLSNNESLYGNKIKRAGSSLLEGSYEIKQWVDKYSWIKGIVQNSGKNVPGFVKRDGANGLPDWLEGSIMGEYLRNRYPTDEFLPYINYIDKIGITKTGMGKYIDGERTIYLNPYRQVLRFNKGIVNRYGYATAAPLTEVVTHLAYHSFYWHTVVKESGKKGGPDEDGDRLPRFSDQYVDDLDMTSKEFTFLRDNATFNAGAKIGPAAAIGDVVKNSRVIYGGDAVRDSYCGRVKMYQKSIKLVDNTAEGFYKNMLKITDYFPARNEYAQTEDKDNDYLRGYSYTNTKVWERQQRILNQATSLSAATPKAAFILPYGRMMQRPVGSIVMQEVFFERGGRIEVLQEGQDYTWRKVFAYDRVLKYGTIDWGSFLFRKAGPCLEIAFTGEGIAKLAGSASNEVQVRYKEIIPHELKEYDASFVGSHAYNGYIELWNTVASVPCGDD